MTMLGAGERVKARVHSGPAPRHSLPAHFGRQLDLARRIGPRDRAEGGQAAIGVRSEEIDAIEQVECLEPQLDARAGNRHLLDGRQIEGPESRAAHTVARRVTERREGGTDSSLACSASSAAAVIVWTASVGRPPIFAMMS